VLGQTTPSSREHLDNGGTIDFYSGREQPYVAWYRNKVVGFCYSRDKAVSAIVIAIRTMK
jgi:hypothetical protein